MNDTAEKVFEKNKNKNKNKTIYAKTGKDRRRVGRAESKAALGLERVPENAGEKKKERKKERKKKKKSRERERKRDAEGAEDGRLSQDGGDFSETIDVNERLLGKENSNWGVGGGGG